MDGERKEAIRVIRYRFFSTAFAGSLVLILAVTELAVAASGS
jgi:hypothetical protein